MWTDWLRVRASVVLSGYISDKRYFGAVVGRVANRIARGRFAVEGKEYKLDTNNGPNALHGGLCGFNKVRPFTSTLVRTVQPALFMARHYVSNIHSRFALSVLQHNLQKPNLHLLPGTNNKPTSGPNSCKALLWHERCETLPTFY